MHGYFTFFFKMKIGCPKPKTYYSSDKQDIWISIRLYQIIFFWDSKKDSKSTDNFVICTDYNYSILPAKNKKLDKFIWWPCPKRSKLFTSIELEDKTAWGLDI